MLGFAFPVLIYTLEYSPLCLLIDRGSAQWQPYHPGSAGEAMICLSGEPRAEPEKVQSHNDHPWVAERVRCCSCWYALMVVVVRRQNHTKTVAPGLYSLTVDTLSEGSYT